MKILSIAEILLSKCVEDIKKTLLGKLAITIKGASLDRWEGSKIFSRTVFPAGQICTILDIDNNHNVIVFSYGNKYSVRPECLLLLNITKALYGLKFLLLDPYCDKELLCTVEKIILANNGSILLDYKNIDYEIFTVLPTKITIKNVKTKKLSAMVDYRNIITEIVK